MFHTYEHNLHYLKYLRLTEQVLLSRLNDPAFFTNIDKTLTELKRIQGDIAYLKDTQPELFI